MGNGETISSVTSSLGKYPGSSKGTPTQVLVYNTNETHWIIKKIKIHYVNIWKHHNETH